MAKSTTPKPAQAAAATSTETANQTAERATEALQGSEQREQVAGEARELAEAQRADIAAGGSGALDPDKTELAKGYTVTDPKAAPVDYAVQTARKPAQRVLNPEDVSGEAMPRAPIANIPYGSQPRTFDPQTGMAPVPEAGVSAEVHGADVDADVDRGSSAALREASAKA